MFCLLPIAVFLDAFAASLLPPLLIAALLQQSLDTHRINRAKAGGGPHWLFATERKRVQLATVLSPWCSIKITFFTCSETPRHRHMSTVHGSQVCHGCLD